MAPLTSLECELLEACLADPGAVPVLADYWLDGVDEARGAFLHLHHGERDLRIDLAGEEARLADHAQAWRHPLLAAGYAERDLALWKGFLQWPLSLAAGSAFDGAPEVVRLSPRYYREHRLVRDGGDCLVHAAEAVTPRTRTPVAIKSARTDDGRRLLEREAKILARMRHRNVACLLGRCARHDGIAYVLPWYGVDLRTLLASATAHRKELGVAFALSVGVQLLDALVHVHHADIVHGEVRTDHVLVAPDGTVTLIDFGFARCDLPRVYPARMISPGIQDEDYRFRYMSPEQCLGREVGAPSDVFTTAGVLCELVGGLHPVTAVAPLELLRQIAHADLTVPRRYPEQIAIVLRMGLERQAQHRPDARTLRDALVLAARLVDIEIGPHVIAQSLCAYGVPA